MFMTQKVALVKKCCTCAQNATLLHNHEKNLNQFNQSEYQGIGETNPAAAVQGFNQIRLNSSLSLS